jgi:hypothetical protein
VYIVALVMYAPMSTQWLTVLFPETSVELPKGVMKEYKVNYIAMIAKAL